MRDRAVEQGEFVAEAGDTEDSGIRRVNDRYEALHIEIVHRNYGERAEFHVNRFQPSVFWRGPPAEQIRWRSHLDPAGSRCGSAQRVRHASVPVGRRDVIGVGERRADTSGVRLLFDVEVQAAGPWVSSANLPTTLLEASDPCHAVVDVDGDWVRQCKNVPFLGLLLVRKGRTRQVVDDRRSWLARPPGGWLWLIELERSRPGHETGFRNVLARHQRAVHPERGSGWRFACQ